MKTIVYADSLNELQRKKLLSILNAKIDCSIISFGPMSKKCNLLSPKIELGNESNLASELVEAHELIFISKHKIPKDHRILSLFFSVGAKKFFRVDENGEINKKDKASILFIFPGSIVPLSLGSHQRAFNLLLNLSASGHVIDVLIPENRNIDNDLVEKSLKSVCNQVFFYKNKRRKFPRTVIFKRWIEKKFRKAQRKNEALPDLFSERAYYKPTESAKRWTCSLFIANGYSSIVVSYAWMLDVVDYIDHARDKFSLICDTHDVQFYRNEKIINRTARLFFRKKKEKSIEVTLLNRCDAILAISKSDANVLKKNVKSKVINASAGFDYAFQPVRHRPVGRPIHFGFIGGGMSANVVALKFILKEWWPIIKNHSPDSNLYIAGSVSKDPEIQTAIFLEDNIKPLGFVKNLNEFYSKFEISLNPVIVSGGLNFKSVEAVFFGKHLLTNPLGMECLSPKFEASVINDPSEITTCMDFIEFNPEKEKMARISAQKKARSIFSNDTVTQDFTNFLKSSI